MSEGQVGWSPDYKSDPFIEATKSNLLALKAAMLHDEHVERFHEENCEACRQKRGSTR